MRLHLEKKIKHGTLPGIDLTCVSMYTYNIYVYVYVYVRRLHMNSDIVRTNFKKCQMLQIKDITSIGLRGKHQDGQFGLVDWVLVD